jgi:CDGSH-type Zn-finger protein/ferredoxin
MNSEKKPSITPAPNGPYIVKALKKCTNKDGSIETSETMALCRCGASSNKPFCDGTHTKIGFSSNKLEGRPKDKNVSYKGQKITIHDNRSVCAHAGYCTDNLASVFRMKDEPWIVPDAASVEDIIVAIRNCPSGALSYSIDDAENQNAESEPAVLIAPNGPYVVSGGIELFATTWGEGASKNEYTLCRCGSSKNKPFCDGTHWYIKFSDDRN